jgi:protein-S-isoprenylcysteine O-methyltransferase Ste14
MGNNRQSWLAASESEFRIRFWIIAVVFFGGFQLYAWDHVPAASALAGLLTRAGGNPRAMQTLIYSIAAAMVVAAAGLRTWAAAYMSSSVVHDEQVRDHRLVADGPYRHLRNPLYLGMILVALGIGLAASRSGFVLIAVAITFFQYRLTRREEAALLATQGELSPLSRNSAADAAQPAATDTCERGDAAVGTGDSRGTLHVGVCRHVCSLRGHGKYAGADVRLHRGHRDGAVDDMAGCERRDETVGAVNLEDWKRGSRP